MTSRYGNCATCGAWGYLPHHVCPPKWDWRFLYTSGEADDWEVGAFYAYDEEDAAEKAAEAYDANDYELSRKGCVVIEVRPTGTEAITKWRASAELVPNYHVSQIADADAT